MKFLTENELRTLYKQSSFTFFSLEEGQKLTPGAQQFLSDRRIKITYQTDNAEVADFSNEQIDLDSENLHWQRLQAAFVQLGLSALSEAPLLAQEILSLEQTLAGIATGEVTTFPPLVQIKEENLNLKTRKIQELLANPSLLLQAEYPHLVGQLIHLYYQLLTFQSVEVISEAKQKQLIKVSDLLQQLILSLIGGNKNE